MRKLLRRLEYIFRRRRFDADLAEEIEFHRAQAQQRLEASGVSAAEAAYASRRALGNVTLALEDARGVWIASWLERLWQDVRYGCRGLAGNPGFSCLILLTLALGIGANTAIFSVIRAVILRPLPFPDSHRLVLLWTDDAKRGLREEQTSVLTIDDWRTESRQFAGLAFFRGEPAVILGGDAPDRVLAEFVSPDLFPLLGVAPIAGRTFTEEEQERGDPVVVLSYGLWQRRFGGSHDVLGQTLAIDQRTDVAGLRIIGVMPPGFAFPSRDAQFWRPVVELDRQRQERFRFTGRSYGVVGRLRPGVTVRAAQAEMSAIGQRLAAAHPAADPTFPGFTAAVVPLLDYYTAGTVQSALWILLAAVGVVLLIACVNAASLLLARGAARSRELAIRSSLGAGRGRLVRQLLTETAILTAAAAAGGLALAGTGVRLLATLAPPGIYPAAGSSYALTDSVRVLARSAQPGIPRLDEISIDSTVLAFTVAVTLVATLLLGVLPAWRMSSVDPLEALKGRATAAPQIRRLRRVGSLLVIAQCALAVLLLAGAGLLIRSFERIQSVEQGFRSDHVLLVRVSLAPSAQRSDRPEARGANLMRRRAFYNQALERIRALPGVRNAGIVTDLLVRGSITGSIVVGDHPAVPAGIVGFAAVSPGFLETLQVPLVRGRFFSDDDVLTQIRWSSADAEELQRRNLTWPVVVNETFVRRFLAEGEPTGKRFRFGREIFEVAGVAGDMRREGPERPAIAEFFTPYTGQTSELAVRTTSDPLALAASVRETVRSVHHQAMVLSATTLERRLGELGAPRQAQTWLLTSFAALALALAAIGVYGIVHYRVAARRHEMAVRIALGARTHDVLRLIVGQGMIAPLAGAAIGLTCALWLTRLMSHLLFEVTATDPATFVGVAVLLIAVALAACWLPARRAARVDPITALRGE